MPANTALTKQDIQDILNDLKVCYSPISVDWPHLEKTLGEIVRGPAAADLTAESVKQVLEILESACDKEIWREKTERVYRSCFILIFAKRSPSILLTSVRELLAEFPTFEGCHEVELSLMLKFRNMMKCGIMLYEARGNKGKLMEVAGRLSGKLCTTGGGSTADTKRREFIYETLGGVVKKKKLTVPRKRKNQPDDASRASSDSGIPVVRKAVKRARLLHETPVRLTRTPSPAVQYSCLHHPTATPTPQTRIVSAMTLEDAADLLLFDNAAFLDSPLYSPSCAEGCYAEAYFCCDKDSLSSAPSECPDGPQSLPYAEIAAALSDSTDSTAAEPFGGVSTNTLRSLHTYPYSPPDKPPVLQRGLTVAFSKPIFTDEFSFHLDLNMFVDTRVET